MIEDMDNKDILDKARMEGMNQGVWLAVQELAYDGRWTQAAEELVSSCGLTEYECRKLQKDIGYHKIGSIFKYNTGMEKIELEVIEVDDSSCDGCVFNNRGYYCMYSCCCNIDREDNTDVIYKEVKRS